MACEYCGNKSGKMDERGNCRSCGGPIEMRVDHDHLDAIRFTAGLITRDEARQRFLGVTAFDSTTPVDFGPWMRGGF